MKHKVIPLGITREDILAIQEEHGKSRIKIRVGYVNTYSTVLILMLRVWWKQNSGLEVIRKYSSPCIAICRTRPSAGSVQTWSRLDGIIRKENAS